MLPPLNLKACLLFVLIFTLLQLYFSISPGEVTAFQMKLTDPTLLLALTTSSLGQIHSAVIIEPKSNVFFSSFTDLASGYTFGIALSTTLGTNFLGYLAGKGTGWSGASLGGAMTNKLLVVVWPNKRLRVSWGALRSLRMFCPFSTDYPFSFSIVNLILYQEMKEHSNQGALKKKQTVSAKAAKVTSISIHPYKS